MSLIRGQVSCSPALLRLGLCVPSLASLLSLRLFVGLRPRTAALPGPYFSAMPWKPGVSPAVRGGAPTSPEAEGHGGRVKVVLFITNTLMHHLPHEGRGGRLDHGDISRARRDQLRNRRLSSAMSFRMSCDLSAG